jgi:hypothetical protein
MNMSCHTSEPGPTSLVQNALFCRRYAETVDIQLHDTSRAYLAILAYHGAMTEASLETPLAERDAAMLDFEERWFTLDVPKEQAIMERFGCSTTRYYQRLNNLIDDPAALGYKPLLVKRLRRQRAQRQAARSARRLHS